MENIKHIYLDATKQVATAYSSNRFSRIQNNRPRMPGRQDDFVPVTIQAWRLSHWLTKTTPYEHLSIEFIRGQALSPDQTLKSYEQSKTLYSKP